MWPRRAGASLGHIYKELSASSTCSRMRMVASPARPARVKLLSWLLVRWLAGWLV